MARTVVAAASFYNKKYYVNPEFSAVPPEIRNELKLICAEGAEKVFGAFMICVDDDGAYFEAGSAEGDALFSETDARLIVSRMEKEKRDLLEKIMIWLSVRKGGAHEPGRKRR